VVKPFDDFNQKIIGKLAMPDTFKIIKKIQSTDRKKLNHTLKDLLIAMLIRFGKRGYIDFDNSKIGEWINEEGEYVKNLLSKLKTKKYLIIEGRKSNRKIYPGPKLVRDCESRTTSKIDSVRDSQSPVRDSQSPSYKKNKENKENNDVVVSLSSKYGFKFDKEIIEMLDGYPDKKLIDLFEYTKSKQPDNPNGFIFDAVKYDWKIPEYKPVKTAYDIAREQDEKNRQRMGPRDDTCLSVAEMRAIRTINYVARAGA
jgi:hypothetical protein